MVFRGNSVVWVKYCICFSHQCASFDWNKNEMLLKVLSTAKMHWEWGCLAFLSPLWPLLWNSGSKKSRRRGPQKRASALLSSLTETMGVFVSKLKFSSGQMISKCCWSWELYLCYCPGLIWKCPSYPKYWSAPTGGYPDLAKILDFPAD